MLGRKAIRQNHRCQCAEKFALTFELPEEYSKIGILFLEAGYLVRVGEKVAWTDKVMRFMRAAVCWDEQGNSLTEIWQKKH